MKSPSSFLLLLPFLAAAILWALPSSSRGQEIIVAGAPNAAPAGGVVGSYTLSGGVVNASLIPGLDPLSMAVSGGDLFLTTLTGIAEYTTSGALVNAAFVSGLTQPNAVAVAGGDMFVATRSGAVGEYDATTGATINASFVTGLDDPTGIAVTGGDLFVLSLAERGSGFSFGIISQYDATTGAVISPVLVQGLGSYALAAAGNDLFVAGSPFGGTIGEYTTAGATVNASLITGLELAAGIAIYGDDLFVTNNDATGLGPPGAVGEYTLSAPRSMPL